MFLDINSKKVNLFSKGHRNPQGLLFNKDVILSTEHGPRGGDEINKFILKEIMGGQFPLMADRMLMMK